ncbi:MAG: hypothetical protein V4671_29035 [Armatimonadota bacterium]
MSFLSNLTPFGHKRKPVIRRTLRFYAWFNTAVTLLCGVQSVFWISHRDQVTPRTTDPMMIYAPVIVTAALAVQTAWLWFRLSRFRGQ